MNVIVYYCNKCGKIHSMLTARIGERCERCGVILGKHTSHEWTSREEAMKHMEKLKIDWIETNNYHI